MIETGFDDALGFCLTKSLSVRHDVDFESGALFQKRLLSIFGILRHVGPAFFSVYTATPGLEHPLDAY